MKILVALETVLLYSRQIIPLVASLLTMISKTCFRHYLASHIGFTESNSLLAPVSQRCHITQIADGTNNIYKVVRKFLIHGTRSFDTNRQLHVRMRGLYAKGFAALLLHHGLQMAGNTWPVCILVIIIFISHVLFLFVFLFLQQLKKRLTPISRKTSEGSHITAEVLKYRHKVKAKS